MIIIVKCWSVFCLLMPMPSFLMFMCLFLMSMPPFLISKHSPPVDYVPFLDVYELFIDREI